MPSCRYRHPRRTQADRGEQARQQAAAAEAPAPHLRLSYVSAPGTAQLEDGVHRLHRALVETSALPADQPPPGAESSPGPRCH
ncbi:hypothetical protein [Streptomyces niger]|uniref:hypothetical protein n=1 Tax=Streptomyces niger TaxID=66373 RepID=UPI000B010297|nr:hypothetical protein [Streptomyces niger]